MDTQNAFGDDTEDKKGQFFKEELSSKTLSLTFPYRTLKGYFDG
jgi:hypothetical protein